METMGSLTDKLSILNLRREHAIDNIDRAILTSVTRDK